MKKYYIYLNGKRYMEIPKEYNIKKDVNIYSSDFYDKLLGGANAAVVGDDNVYVQTWIMFPERYGRYGKYNEPIPQEAQKYLDKSRDKTIRHELQHIAQHEHPKWLGKSDMTPSGFFMKELTDKQRYSLFYRKYGKYENPYEVEAREWGEKDIQLKKAMDEVLERLGRKR